MAMLQCSKIFLFLLAAVCGSTNTCYGMTIIQKRHKDLPPARRQFLRSVGGAVVFGWLPLPVVSAEKVGKNDPRETITIQIRSREDSLGLEVFDTKLRGENIVAIRRVLEPNNNSNLQEGMILKDFSSAKELVERIQSGPYPVELEFINLAAGGDAFSDLGTSLVTPRDALTLAQRTEGSPSSSKEYSITTLRKPASKCLINSRRNDVLEISYEASYLTRDGRKIVYDASAFRGTGLPYQMVLGSGDMIPGVDQGLYDMCPGESRLLKIPPLLGYGNRGTQAFRIPADYVGLEWKVDLVSIDTNIREGNNDVSREEREARALY